MKLLMSYKKAIDKQCVELEARSIMQSWNANRLYAAIGASIICLNQGKVSEAHDWLINTFNQCEVPIDDEMSAQDFFDHLVKGEPESIEEIARKLENSGESK